MGIADAGEQPEGEPRKKKRGRPPKAEKAVRQNKTQRLALELLKSIEQEQLRLHEQGVFNFSVSDVLMKWRDIAEGRAKDFRGQLGMLRSKERKMIMSVTETLAQKPSKLRRETVQMLDWICEHIKLRKAASRNKATNT